MSFRPAQSSGATIQRMVAPLCLAPRPSRPAAVLLVGLLVFVLLLPAASLRGVVAQQADPAIVTVHDGGQDAPPGTTTWEVRIQGAHEIYGLDIELRFDPAQGQVVSATPEADRVEVQLGPFLSPDFVVENRANNETGVIRAAFTQVAPAGPVSGDGVLLTVVMDAADGAEAMPGVVSIVLARADGSVQPVAPGEEEPVFTQTPGPLEVQPTPIPTPAPADDGATPAAAGTPGAGTPPPATPVPGSGEDDALDGEGDDGAAADGTPSAGTPPPDSDTGAGNGDGGGSWRWLAGGIGALAVVAGGALLLYRRSRD